MLTRVAMALLCVAVTAPVFAASALAPYSARYDVITHGLRAGEALFKLQKLAANRYRFSSQSHTTGIVSLFRHDRIDESSTFRVTPDGDLRAQAYRYERSGENRSQHIQFDWTHHVAHSAYRGKKKSITIPDDATDAFLAQLKLSRRVAAGMHAGKFPVVNHNKLDTYHLKVVGDETIRVPAGTFAAIRVERADPGSTRKTVFWLAPKLHDVPVKVEQFHDGKSEFRLELNAVGFPEIAAPKKRPGS